MVHVGKSNVLKVPTTFLFFNFLLSNSNKENYSAKSKSWHYSSSIVTLNHVNIS